jgi:hypothetical protein
LVVDASAGPWATTTFTLAPGTYTLTAAETGASLPITVTAGQTVLVLSELAGTQTDSAVSPAPSATSPATSTTVPTTIPTATTPSSLPTATAQPTRTPTRPRPTATSTADGAVISFAADDWSGAYPDVVAAVYQRPCVAVYGAESRYPSAQLTFTVDAADGRPATLVLTGLDDEWAVHSPISITVNGVVVFQGTSEFANWDPAAATVNWSQMTVTIDPGILTQGRNEIVVANQSDSANFGLPPYILLAEATLTIGSAD